MFNDQFSMYNDLRDDHFAVFSASRNPKTR